MYVISHLDIDLRPANSVHDHPVCTKLSDLAVLELATLPSLRRLAMAGLPKITRVALSFLAEHALNLAHLHVSHCTDDTLDVDVIRLLLRKLVHLEHLSGSGVLAFTRKGIGRFSEPAPQVCTVFQLPRRSILCASGDSS